MAFNMSCILIGCMLALGSATPMMRRDTEKATLKINADGSNAPVDEGEKGQSLVDLGPEVAGADKKEEELVELGKSSTELSEADRLWQQFRVLDGRFSKAAHAYMDMALTSVMGHEDALLQLGEQETAQAASLTQVRTTDGVAATSQLPSSVPPHHKDFVSEAATSFDKVTYGFYLHVFYEAAAVVHQLRDVRKFYPEAPVYIMSDGGANFTGICKLVKNCKFAWRAPANDRWNPKPFLDRFREGAEWLQERKAEWTIMLEPDVTLNHRATTVPIGVDAGGLKDMWNPRLPDQLRSSMTELGKTFSGNKNFSLKWEHFGLAGGSIIRTKAAIHAFRPDSIDWPAMEKLWNDSMYSSDVSMLIALAAHGFNYYPWEDLSQGKDEFQPTHETAFQHHSSGEVGGKPWYGKELALEDRMLVSAPPDNMRALALGQCQHCVWAEEEACWPKEAGKGFIQCQSDQKNFRTKAWKVDDPNPSLFQKS